MKQFALRLACVFLSVSSLSAQEKTYSGRTFDEWKILAVNDLEDETRLKAATAIGELGIYDHREEAVQTLKQMIKNEQSTPIVERAYMSILEFGDDATETIWEGLKSHDEVTQSQVLEIVALHFGRTSPKTLEQRRAPQLAEAVVPVLLEFFAHQLSSTSSGQSGPTSTREELIQRLREANDRQERERIQIQLTASLRGAAATREIPVQERRISQNREQAAICLHEIFASHLNENLAAKALPVFTTAVKSNDETLANLGLYLIGSLGEHAAPAVPLLIENLGKDNWGDNGRGGRVTNLGGTRASGFGGFGSGPPPFGGRSGFPPDAQSRFGNSQTSAFVRSSRSGTTVSSSRTVSAAQAIIQLGPIAKEAETKLEELANQQRSPSVFHLALEAIRDVQMEKQEGE